MSLFKQIIFSCLTFFISFSVFAQTADLTLKVANIEQVKGKIQVGLYDNAEDFPKGGKGYKKAEIEVDAKTVSYTFEDLPLGEYAIAVHHDLNCDKKLQRNFIGLPKESYGFSQNYKPILSVPDFEDAKFCFDSDKKISIDLINP